MRRAGVRGSRRLLMYALVAGQLLVLAAIVAPQELNRALDSGATVDVEIVQARATKDPFRGAHVRGQSALDLNARAVVMPAGLQRGDRVLVVFAAEPGRQPRIVSVERDGRAAPFTATRFTLPGRVLDGRGEARVVRRAGRLTARVGEPSVAIELELPAAVPVDESAVARFSGPALVRARLHAGFLGRPYFTDVRLTGRAWPADVRFVYDDARERLLVLSPRDMAARTDSSHAVRSDLFVFDATGKELSTSEIEGRVLDAFVEADGHVLAFIAGDRWSQSEVWLARLGEDGRILQRSVPVAFDRVLGWDAQAGGAWILTGSGSVRPQPPHFIQRMTLAGLREPRLGPFESVPRAVRTVGGDVWVVETERHRVSRLDAASGQTLREYRDLNGPVDVTVDGGSIHVIEANRTQLTRLAEDGRVLWRVPRFYGLAWAVAEPGTGGGWVGASMFEGRPGGILKFGPDGTVVRVPATAGPAPRQDWRHRLGDDVVRSARDGRLFFLEADAIAILSPDGVTVTRVVGFRFTAEPRLRSSS